MGPRDYTLRVCVNQKSTCLHYTYGGEGTESGSGEGERNPSLRHYSPKSARMWIGTWIVLPGDSREPQTLNLDLRPSRTGNAHSARQKPNFWMNVPSGQVAKTQTNNFSKTISTHTKVTQTQQNKTSGANL